jgi:hypothetical protein
LIDAQPAFVVHVDDADVGARCLAARVQGSRLELCSATVRITSSPARRFAAPQVLAIRLMASVEPRVKMISFGLGALMNRATDWRAAAGGRGAARQRVDRRRVRIVGRIEVGHGVDHGLWAQRRRGAVEVGERAPGDLLPQRGKRCGSGPRLETRLASRQEARLHGGGRQQRQKMPAVHGHRDTM